MMSHRPCTARLVGTMRFAAWPWLVILLFLSSFVGSLALSSPATDHLPRAAIISLAHEDDLQPLLSSIYKLEKTFNKRYGYDWIFFSTEPVSDDFKRQTSDATSAKCFYEVIVDKNVSLSQLTPGPRFIGPVLPGLRGGATKGGDQTDQTAPLLRQIYRLDAECFAKGDRLGDYDCLWRIDPGARFTREIPFDVFRFMSDNGISYGFHEALFAKGHTQMLRNQFQLSMDKSRDLLHAGTGASKLLRDLGESDSVFATDNEAGDTDATEDKTTRLMMKIAFEDSPDREEFAEADWQQDDGEGASSPAEAFAYWLSGIYKTSISPTFEIGSLSFFHSPEDHALLDYLDNIGDLYYRGRRDVLVPSLSASMFLPQKSAWNLRKKRTLPSLAKSTPDPELEDLEDLADDGMEDMFDALSTGIWQLGESMDRMKQRFTLWEQMARDLGRQETIPSLISGNTVIDERNFALT